MQYAIAFVNNCIDTYQNQSIAAVANAIYSHAIHRCNLIQPFVPNGNLARRLVGTPIAREKEGCLAPPWITPNAQEKERQRKTGKDRGRQGKTENSEIQGHAMFTLWQGVCLAPPWITWNSGSCYVYTMAGCIFSPTLNCAKCSRKRKTQKDRERPRSTVTCLLEDRPVSLVGTPNAKFITTMSY